MNIVAFGCVFAALFGQNYAGDFIGRVKVTYDVFTVLEGERFEMKCSATHEDKRPQLLWYFVDHSAERTNLTGLGDSGKGNTATRSFSRARAKLDDSGDYYCFAMVGFDESEQKTSAGIPIQVIKKDQKPRLRITQKRVKGKYVLKCEVHPMGRGYLTWRRDGNRLKYEKLVSELELETSTAGDYHCHGNLTLGGYTYFTSNAYATAKAGWSYMARQTSLLTTILICIAVFLNA